LIYVNVFFVGFYGPSYEHVAGLPGCLVQADSLCFNQVIVRVRRNASHNMEVATVASTSRPHLSSTTNMSLESTADQSNVSSRHNASVHLPASELSPSSILLPTNVTDNMTDLLDIIEASIFHQCCRQLVCSALVFLLHLYIKVFCTFFNDSVKVASLLFS